MGTTECGFAAAAFCKEFPVSLVTICRVLCYPKVTFFCETFCRLVQKVCMRKEVLLACSLLNVAIFLLKSKHVRA